jgi:transposase
MYSVFEKNQSTGNKVQFIKVMSTTPRKMVIIPLTGYTKFGGTIKVILDFHKQRLELHTTNELGLIENKLDTVIPLDAGISEVFMDEMGNAYEPTFGKTIGEVSKQLNKTMKARNKSYALKKTSSKYKAHRIAKFNLGKNKLRDRKRKTQVRIKQQISQAIHQVVKERTPGIIVTERLDIRGRAKSKGMSRLVSYWMRGSLKERLNFLALAEGFCHKQVNPAYSSQMCPTCLFVHKGNRAGDIFHCLNCGHTDHADRVAAINLFARYYDTEITVYTPKTAVFSILQGRFAASLEKSNGMTEEVPVELTVSGRTDTDRLLCQSETPSSKSNNGRGTEMSCLTMF